MRINKPVKFKLLSKRLFFFTVVIFMLFSSCGNDPDYAVNIVSEKDTIKLGEKYTANLSITNNNEVIFSNFFIVLKGDTSILEYDHEKGVALFRFQSSKTGIKTYNGFARFKDKHGNFVNKSFTIKFQVVE